MKVAALKLGYLTEKPTKPWFTGSISSFNRRFEGAIAPKGVWLAVSGEQGSTAIWIDLREVQIERMQAFYRSKSTTQVTPPPA
jgi:hypothetical protein